MSDAHPASSSSSSVTVGASVQALTTAGGGSRTFLPSLPSRPLPRSPLERSLSLSGLSAKMRLKKQRLLESIHSEPSTVSATNAAASMLHLPHHVYQQKHLAVGPRGSLPWELQRHQQHLQQQQQQVSPPPPPPPDDPNSALHRLAEAAERKQVSKAFTRILSLDCMSHDDR